MIRASDFIYRWSDLHDEEFEIEIVIDSLYMQIVSQEKTWQEIQDKFNQMVENDAKLNSMQESQGDYYRHQYLHQEQSNTEMRRMQRYSMLTSIFNFVESRLGVLCEKIEADNNFTKKLKNMAGDGYVDKKWNYLCEVYNIDSTDTQPFIDSLQKYRGFRNAITHSGGYIDKFKRDALLPNTTVGITIEEGDRLYYIDITDVEFLKNLLRACSGILFAKQDIIVAS
ncbi:MAG TPA: hypothetical protein PLO67_08365, partial [Saprospiraceae bacterium]|nr:hypothetical protein [Saprospiraceae bacterium]